MRGSAYSLIRPILFLQDSETAHRRAMRALHLVARGPVRAVIRKTCEFDHAALRTNVFGLSFRNPIGLAAGFDKNGEYLHLLGLLGFGHVEIGTITPRPQDGNPKPRLFRLAKDRALINRMGFNNAGSGFVAERLHGLRSGTFFPFVLGINIGKNKTTPNETADGDYRECFERLALAADYITVNVSSPNTPGLRELQDKKHLLRILTDLVHMNGGLGAPRPILLKIAPDLATEQLDDIVRIVQEVGLDGVIATNTTVSREGLRTNADAVAAMGQGGLSGRPLRVRAVQVVRYISGKLGKDIPVIGVGGVETSEDAYSLIKAGASLIQIYTGFIYRGPAIVRQICRGLVKLLDRDGFRNVREAVGVEAGNRERDLR